MTTERPTAASPRCCRVALLAALLASSAGAASAQRPDEIPVDRDRELTRHPLSAPSPAPDPGVQPKHYRLGFDVGLYVGERLPGYVDVVVSPELDAEWRALPTLALALRWGASFLDDALGFAVAPGNLTLGAFYVLEPEGDVRLRARAGLELIGPIASSDDVGPAIALEEAIAMRALLAAWRFAPDVTGAAGIAEGSLDVPSALLRLEASVAVAPLLCVRDARCVARGDDTFEVDLEAQAGIALLLDDGRVALGVRFGAAVLTVGASNDDGQLSVTPYLSAQVGDILELRARFVLGLDEPYGLAADRNVWGAFAGARADLESW